LEIQSTTRHDRMRPGVLLASIGLMEPALFSKLIWCCFHDRDVAFLATHVQMTLGEGDRVLTQATILPFYITRVPI
jgi:hypothetical protein